MGWNGPILDNHLHLGGDRNRAVQAVEDFVSADGTHLLVVNKPSWWHGVEVDGGEDFRTGYDVTCEVVAVATDHLPGRAWPVLGVHPALLSRLVEERDIPIDDAVAIMREGIDVAGEYVAAGTALAIKSGRPHYPVDEPVWEASNDVLRYAFERAAALDCAVQLHTESGSDFGELAAWADDAGLPADRVVKHYADGPITGPTPSVIARKDPLDRVIERDAPFLMETDYLDDPDRPGAVLGPKTVPRRVQWLAERGHEAAIRRAHVETPARIYGIDLEAFPEY